MHCVRELLIHFLYIDGSYSYIIPSLWIVILSSIRMIISHLVKYLLKNAISPLRGVGRGGRGVSDIPIQKYGGGLSMFCHEICINQLYIY